MSPLGRILGRGVIATSTVVVGFTLAENYDVRPKPQVDGEGRADEELKKLPTREAMLKRLKSGEEFDLLVIGGGATGAGAALDAAARGLNVACVEREDFSSGTSSRSTKIIWAGSRYLVNAFVSLFHSDLRLLRDPVKTLSKFASELHMVQNCHRERRFLLEMQPHLANWIPLAVPFTQWILWPPPFGFAPAALGPLGLFPAFFKVYDAMGGFCSPPSHIMTPKRADRKYPMLAQDIKYSSIFYEGQHDDARTNLAIALTAANFGAALANYCTVVGFTTAEQQRKKEAGVGGRGWFGGSAAPASPLPADYNPNLIVGATLRDELTGETFSLRTKGVVLCGGPFTDELRVMEEKAAAAAGGKGSDMKKAIRGATGIHIVLPSYYLPAGIGLVDMNTSDGRFLFLLPWEGHVLVGTTDTPCPDINMRPVPEEEQIQWLLHELGKYLSPELKVRRQDVLSAWSGIRPLAIDPHAKDTASVSRDHVISVNENTGVVFISGGKWTTYREMAQDLIDKVLSVSPSLKATKVSPCSTLDIALHGKAGHSVNLPIRLAQEFSLPRGLANHLSSRFGGHAREVSRIAKEERGPANASDLSQPVVSGHAYIRAEVVFAARHEMAMTVEDVIARRLRLAFLNKADAQRAIEPVADLMAKELRWTSAKRRQEVARAHAFLVHFGGQDPRP